MEVLEHSKHRSKAKGPVHPQLDQKLDPWWSKHYPFLKATLLAKCFLSSTLHLGHGGEPSQDSKGLLIQLEDTNYTSARDKNVGVGNRRDKKDMSWVSLEKNF